MQENRFSEYTDEQLAVLARNGEEEATDTLIRRYKAVVRSKAKLYFVAGSEADDVVQEGMIGLLKAVRSYEEGKNASFKTYADLCISRQIYTAMKHASTLKNSPLNNSVSIDNTIDDENGEGTFAELFSASSEDEPESALIFKEKMKKLEDEKGEFFSDFESRVLMGFLQGRNCAEIGEDMDKSPKSIDNALQRIRKKLENHLTSK